MSERDGYDPGVPCWIDTGQSDAYAAVSSTPGCSAGKRGRDAAGNARQTLHVQAARSRRCRHRLRPAEAPHAQPAWGTYIWVESAENTAAEIAKAGGSVVMEPFPSLDSGRIAVVADPAWAVFGVWQPGEDRGARVTEL